MTKLLHISSGNYVIFISSVKYDMEHDLEFPRDLVERYEDSYDFDAGRTLENYIEEIISGVETLHPNNDDLPEPNYYSREEFEIIYD